MRFESSSVAETLRSEVAVIFASHEPRCLTILDSLTSHGFAGRVRALFCEDAISPPVSEHLRTMERMVGSRRFTSVPVSAFSAIPAVAEAREHAAATAALIDITCFTRENLFAFLWAADIAGRLGDVFFGYTPAHQYGPWLSRDFGRTHNLIGFEGPPTFAPDRALVCLVGFQADRALAVIEHLEPTRVRLLIGSNPSRDEFLERNRRAIDRIVGGHDWDVRSVDVSDPEAARQDLKGHIAELRSESASLHSTPFNNKLSCLGLFACAQEDPSIRIWNSIPATYNYRSFSRGAGLPLWYRTVDR